MRRTCFIDNMSEGDRYQATPSRSGPVNAIRTSHTTREVIESVGLAEHDKFLGQFRVYFMPSK